MNIKVGNTPMIELTKEIRAQNGVRIFAKLEGENEGGSIKSRVALALIEGAEKKGFIKSGGYIVEATSGNTGVGLALVAKKGGYRAKIFMPSNLSGVQSKRIEEYGGEVVFTPSIEGMQGAVDAAKAFVSGTPNSFYCNQFCNPVCAAVHYQTTGQEILAQAVGKVDIFVAGVGTGGTLTGAGMRLKEKNTTLKVVAVEPATSPLLSQGWAGRHGIRGIGANFLPSVLDKDLIDEVVLATEHGAAVCRSWLKKRCNLSVGISSGAALYACLQLAGRAENQGKTIVTIFPSTD